MRRWLVCAAAVLMPTAAAAQVQDRVAETRDGVVRFAYALRDGVEICRQGVRTGGRHMAWRTEGGDRGAEECRSDFVEVELSVRDGDVRDVELVRDRRRRAADARDLGVVPAEEASRYLLSLARSGATRGAAEDAVLPAVLADVAEVWRDLIGLAEDRSLPRAVRSSALFWLGQEAADAVAGELTGVALREDEDQEVRNAAVFALSQRPADEAVPALMEVARTADHAETRRQAMFWLAQVDDDRVTDFFERVLLGRSR